MLEVIPKQVINTEMFPYVPLNYERYSENIEAPWMLPVIENKFMLWNNSQ